MLQMIAKKFGNEFELFFANYIEKNNYTIPEKPISEKVGVKLNDDL